MANQAKGHGQDRPMERTTGQSESMQPAHKETEAGVKNRLKDVAATAAETAGTAMSSVGSGMTSVAETIRQRAPHEGTMGSAATAIADSLQAGGAYLRHHGLDEMSADLTACVRRYPLESVLSCLAAGFLFGLAISRR
jgi:hypothetical protein